MRALVVLILVSLAFIWAQHSPCEQLKTQASCVAATDNGTSCVWCLCSAVPSSCFSCAEAHKLPHTVFHCDYTTGNCPPPAKLA